VEIVEIEGMQSRVWSSFQYGNECYHSIIRAMFIGGVSYAVPVLCMTTERG
jgi:hypothetical protein